MKNHIKNKHPAQPKYKCRECEFTSELVTDTCDHTFIKHTEQDFNFNQNL